jgi:AcrR family transcriptional regulator
MLIHYFGTKAGLDHAVIRAIEDRLRLQAEQLARSLGGLVAAKKLAVGFRTPQSAQVRALFRTLVSRAFAGDAVAVAALIGERARWIALFEDILDSREEATNTVVLLLGSAMDAILNDMLAESRSGNRRRANQHS